MFKRKPVIQVLKVKTEKREVVTEESYGMGYTARSRSSKTVKNVSYTIVLMVKDGELCTKEFNGSWNLDDVKKWEDL